MLITISMKVSSITLVFSKDKVTQCIGGRAFCVNVNSVTNYQ